MLYSPFSSRHASNSRQAFAQIMTSFMVRVPLSGLSELSVCKSRHRPQKRVGKKTTSPSSTVDSLAVEEFPRGAADSEQHHSAGSR